MSDEKEDSVLLGKFTIGNILGAGAFGEVYLARNLRTGKRVAIKAIEKEKLKEINCGDDRIKTEISIMRTLKHPNIVELYEVMASKTKIYLVMEYINGGTVYEIIRSARETGEHTSRRYFQQLISAVDFCHRNGIYHRDLKPDNLLLDNRGNLKVADFGLSALQDQVGKDGLFHTLCGAVCYVATEVLSGENYDGVKADIDEGECADNDMSAKCY